MGQLVNGNSCRSPLQLVAAGAVAALVAFAPARAHDTNISVNGLDFGGDDFLEELIALDADDIAELRGDLDEARGDVLDAIDDIEEAREDVKGVPGAGAILKIAFGAARKGVSAAADETFAELRGELDEAETDLAAARSDIGEAEFNETGEAIAAIREGIDGLEAALEEVEAALR